MLKAALAFIPLLGGYLFVSTWHETRYLIKREDSQKLYIRAAFWGIWLFLLAFAITNFIRPDLEPALAFAKGWSDRAVLLDTDDQQIDSAFWVAVLAFTLLLGMFSGYLLNWLLAFKTISLRELIRLIVRRVKGRDHRLMSLIYEHSTRSAVKRAIYVLNADLDLILLRALEQNMPISVTLSHGKVYVGYVTGAIEPGDKRDMLRVLPVVSGYRAGDRMKVEFTTWYVSIYQSFSKDQSLSHLNPELFEVVFPLSEIKSVNLFDIKAYHAFQQANPPTS